MGKFVFGFFRSVLNTGHTGAFGTQEEEPRIDLPIIVIPLVCTLHQP